MSFKTKVINEFNNNPIAVSSGFGSFIFAIIAWVTSLLQSNSSSQLTDPKTLSVAFSVNNVMLIIAFFLFITTFASTLSRLSAKINQLFAFFISIILATLTIFITYIFLNLRPPKLLDELSLYNFNNILFWATVVLFTAVCGQSFLIFMVKPTSTQNEDTANEVDDEKKNRETNAGFVLCLIIFFFWIKMVDYGQMTLIKSFLPANWQPVTQIQKK